MTESTKTVLFVAAAAASLLIAFAMGPSGETFDVQELVGEKLNQFELDVPKRLKVVKFDPETATTNDFEVAEQDSTWVIPSKHGYPADADRQLAKAVNCISDLEILRVAAESAEQHASLGVLSPSSSKLNSKAEGVGVRVMMSSGNGDSLVDMIIGKSVKDADDQRYVRNTDQDIVYVVNLDPEGLSTDFDDWIEGDLLKINPLDIRQVHIKDYSAEFMMTLQGPRVQYDQRGDFSLVYDNSNSKWLGESLQRYDAAAKKFTDDPLGENQELNSDVLQEFRDGLDDLRIVDVERKPEGLSADLKAGGDFLKNEAAGSLIPRGFAPVSLSPNGQAEILSSEGELTCTLQDGVEYVLRFGNLKIDGEENATSDAQAKSADDSAADSDASSESDQGIHRYLFVTTRFNSDVLEKPEDQPLPPLPEGVDSEEAIEQQEEKADSEKKDGAGADDSAVSTDLTDGADGAGDSEPAASSEAESEENGEDAEAENSEQSPEDKAAELKEIVAQRKSIRAENQRRQDEYDQKIEDGNKRVQELNERFGDWYYVIANDVYKKIHLDRDQLVREKKEEDDKSAASPVGNPLSGLPGAPPMGIPGHPPISPAAMPVMPVEETVEETKEATEEAPVKETPKAETEAPNAEKAEEKPTEDAEGTPAETATEESTEAPQDSDASPPAESDTEETPATS